MTILSSDKSEKSEAFPLSNRFRKHFHTGSGKADTQGRIQALPLYSNSCLQNAFLKNLPPFGRPPSSGPKCHKRCVHGICPVMLGGSQWLDGPGFLLCWPSATLCPEPRDWETGTQARLSEGGLLSCRVTGSYDKIASSCPSAMKEGDTLALYDGTGCIQHSPHPTPTTKQYHFLLARRLRSHPPAVGWVVFTR